MVIPGAGRAAAGTHIGTDGRATALGGGWGTAQEVPGTATLNQGGNAQVGSVSCPSPGNCSAGGQYSNSSGATTAFVLSEANGTWGTAREVPGIATLNQGGGAGVTVSCPSAGNCSGGGAYIDSSGLFQAFVVSETKGIWRTAKEVPGTATLNQGGNAGVDSVSCPSAGNCSAGGGYTDSSGAAQALIVSETNGTWRTAKEVPGIATLNQGGDADVESVSCSSAGNCSAGGYYTDGSQKRQAFIVSETNGTWHTAKEVPGTASLNKDGWHGWRDPQWTRKRWVDSGMLDDNGGTFIVLHGTDRVGSVSWRKIQTGPIAINWAIGIGLAAEFRGRGYGSEAQRLLVRYLFAHTQVNRIEATTEITNVAEQRALEKAGFTREGILRGSTFRQGQWHDQVIYSLLRDEVKLEDSAAENATV
jgi:RimJ/RimL family protein N-acetyltransferase